jgi:hypothetical protein
MASSGVRRLAMSKMVAKEKKPVKAVWLDCLLEYWEREEEKYLVYPKTVTVDMLASQRSKEATRKRFNKTKGKGMTLKEADTLRFKVD